jgi:hypothetical protein
MNLDYSITTFASSFAGRNTLGIHFLSDIVSGAALGAFIVLASQRLPIPRAAFQILKVQRKWPVAFCAGMFVAVAGEAVPGLLSAKWGRGHDRGPRTYSPPNLAILRSDS